MITRTGLFSSNRRVGLVGAVQASYVLIERSGRVRASDSIGSCLAATFDVKKPKLHLLDDTEAGDPARLNDKDRALRRVRSPEIG